MNLIAARRRIDFNLLTVEILDIGWTLFLFVLFLVVVPVLYLLPTIVAVRRRVPNVGSVAVINVFLGWMLIGWVIALAMAARSVPPTSE